MLWGRSFIVYTSLKKYLLLFVLTTLLYVLSAIKNTNYTLFPIYYRPLSTSHLTKLKMLENRWLKLSSCSLFLSQQFWTFTLLFTSPWYFHRTNVTPEELMVSSGLIASYATLGFPHPCGSLKIQCSSTWPLILASSFWNSSAFTSENYLV